MASATQLSAVSVTDAGYVRLAQLGQARLDLVRDFQSTEHIDTSLFDLRTGLEELARTADPVQQNIIKGYLQETYGLRFVGTDPLLRPLLPPIPATGAAVRRLVLGVNGSVAGVNGKLVGVGAELVAATGPPVFNTTLTTGQTIGAVTFTGDASDVFSFDMPMLASTGGPQQLLLYVAGVQVGRIDFPLTAAGNYFRLVHLGTSYLSTFQVIAAPYALTLNPE
jgi:hypothetical protein